MPRTAFPRIVSVATCLAVLTGLSLVGASPDPHQTDRFGDWTPPVNLGETVNSPSQEILPALSKNGKSLNLLYGTQTTVRPPRFRFFVNDPGLVTRDYGYWVENQLRERFQMEGVPVSIDFVRKT